MMSQTDTFDSESSQAYYDRSPLRLDLTSPPFPNIAAQEADIPQRPEEHTSPTITETDYLPWPEDPQYPYPLLSDTKSKRMAPPIDPYDVVSKALAFETRHSALNSSAIILLLKPLVPEGVIDEHQASAVIRQHHNRLMGMGLFVEAALLRNLCVRGWPGEAMDYWGDNYPAVFGPAQERQRVSVGFACARCHKPRAEIDRAAAAAGNGPGVWRCESCRAAVAPCAVCGHRDLDPSLLGSAPLPTVVEGLTAAAKGNTSSAADTGNDLILATWWYCPGCSHGGHASCLEGWHAPIASTTTGFPNANRSRAHQQSQFLSQQHHYQDHTNPASAAASRPPSPGQSAADLFPLPDIDVGYAPETYSGGCCPFDGCGHACLPGRWRDETAAARTEELGRAVRDQTRGVMGGASSSSGIPGGGNKGSVSSIGGMGMGMGMGPAAAGRERRVSAAAAVADSFDVPQSRAVEHVRELSLSGLNLGGGGAGGGARGHHHGDSYPYGGGDETRDRDRDREPQRPNTTTGAGIGIFSSILGTSPGRGSGAGSALHHGHHPHGSSADSAATAATSSGGSGSGTGGGGTATNGNGTGTGAGGAKPAPEKERRKSVKFASTTEN